MIDIRPYIARLDWHCEPQGLYAPIDYALAEGGKRLRPTLALLACQLCGEEAEKAVPAALALEIFHNFTLLHDDVMDHASVRRGRPSVNKQFGDNTAILSGDEMLIEAYKQLQHYEPSLLAQLLPVFNKMASEVCEGQQYDMDFETMADEQVSKDDYMNMIRLKTSVLLAAALQMGAIVAGGTKQQQEDLYAFGIHLGLAFQIQDDVLDVYGDERTFGKAIGGDICEGKKTYLFLAARDNASEEEKALLRQMMALPSATAQERKYKIEQVTLLYNRLRAREEAMKGIGYHTTQALNILSRFPQQEARQTLEQLAQQLLTRQS